MEELYKLLLVERENDSKRYWTIFNLMNIINAGLLALILTKGKPNEYFQDLAACFGIILCVVWFLAELRMIGWIRLWEKKIKDIERCYLKEINLISESKNLYDLGFRIFRHRKISFPWRVLPTRSIGPVLSILFLLVWLFIRFPCIPKSIPILTYLIGSYTY